jgi:hypothetical protein
MRTHLAFDHRPHRLHRAAAVDADDALRLLGAAPRVARAHALEERIVETLEAIGHARRGTARRGLRGLDVEPQRQVGLARALHPSLQLRQHGPVEAAPRTLVGEGRVGEAVAQHGGAGGQRRLDALAQVIAPRREHQQAFRQRVHLIAQEKLAQLFGQWRATGLAGHQHVVALGADPARKRVDVRALARAVDAFEGDEAAAHRVPPRW